MTNVWVFTEVIVGHETDVSYFLPHGDLFNTTLVQGELLCYIYITEKVDFNLWIINAK